MKAEQLDFSSVPITATPHNRSDASLARAQRLDTGGKNSKTSKRQRQALELITKRGFYGLVGVELNELLGLGSQSSSPVLHSLHKNGLIVRLKEQRKNCQIYVLEEFVLGREIHSLKVHVCVCPNCGWKGTSR